MNNSTLILIIVSAYFGLLMLISKFTSRKANNLTFFAANKNAPWYVVAFGMIGASLSGVTFISVPGWVATQSFAYMQMVLGYLVGYAVIAYILLPLYYRLNLISIYSYLEERFGVYSYKTGASFFLLSRMFGASFRLFLVANTLQFLVFDDLAVPFWVTVLLSILLIWVYTYKGGIGTIIWTDTLQTLFMLIAVGLSLYLLKDYVVESGQSLLNFITQSEYSQVFFFDDFTSDSRHFIKQFVGGIFIAITMTGLDQDMMQKNLSCRNLRDAQKNMLTFSVSLVFVNLLFLILGIVLMAYAQSVGINSTGDALFPAVAFSKGLHPLLGISFVVGLVAAAYSSADSALTALTTSFCVDILGQKDYESQKSILQRRWVHIAASITMGLCIIAFKYVLSSSVIEEIFNIAGFTYGPLLGLFGFGLFTRYAVKDKWVPWVAVLAPIICIVLKKNSLDWFSYQIGFELILINGALSFFGLWLLRIKPVQ